MNPAFSAAEPTVALRVENLVKHFSPRKRWLRKDLLPVRAVDGVSFAVRERETLGLVGESGCGKTTLGRMVLQLIPPTAGEVYLGDRLISNLPPGELRKVRRDLQVVFQDPYASLNPRMSVMDIIAEAPVVHGLWQRAERRRLVAELLGKVGLRAAHMERLPREFSGGQRQRIGIARALAMSPKVIVCDEPVSALDVSIQSQILNLMVDLQQELGLSYLFIAHNLAVVRHISHRVGVMYLGRLVELAGVDDLYQAPRHPYTVSLLSAVPEPDPTVQEAPVLLKGDVPNPSAPPPGCPFHTRCWLYEKLQRPSRCTTERPPLDGTGFSHLAACHFSDEVASQRPAERSTADVAPSS
jgi:peptide/nickel transport system ATP-binding protein/oligopeptide transport system ATP-binding protein